MALFLCFVTLTFDSKINWFPGLMVEHFYIKFGERTCTGFCDIVWKNRHTNSSDNSTPVITVDMGKET